MASVVVFEGNPGPSTFAVDSRYPYLYLAHMNGAPAPANAVLTYALGEQTDMDQGVVLHCPSGDVTIAGVGPYRVMASDSPLEAFQLGR